MNPDFLKVVVVLLAFIYLILKLSHFISLANLRLMIIGLSLLMFAAILDFSDDIQSLDYVPILGKKAPYHDFLEDQVADTTGLALFFLGVFRELRKRKT